MFNPARIFKLYGSLAMKGDHVQDRPHRWASIDMSDVPADVDVFASLNSQIEQFEGESSPTPADLSSGQAMRPARERGWDADTSKRALEEVLAREGLAYRRTEKNGRVYFHFETCPAHTDDDGHRYECCVLVEANGRFGASCKHNADAGWQDFKSVIGWGRHADEVKKELGLMTGLKGEHGAPGRDTPIRELPWEWPVPLGHFDLPPFPLEAFPGELGALQGSCVGVAESYQVPVDMVAMLALATGGAALAKAVEVHVRGDHIEPVNLFTAIAMPPGSRKSSVFRAVTQPLSEFEQQEVERLKPAIGRNRNERGILEEALKHAQAAYFEMGADPAIDVARRLLNWISSEELSVFSRRDAFNAVRGTVRKVTELDSPLQLLADHGYIRERIVQREGPGRKPSPIYEVNPQWQAQNPHNAHNRQLTLNSADSAQCAQEVSI